MIYLANHPQAFFLWFLPLLFLLAIPFIGPVIYLIFGRSKRIRSSYR